MESPQSVVSPFNSSSILSEPEKKNANLFAEDPGCLSRETAFQRKEVPVSNSEDIFGVLEVYVRQARDIHNICIYQNQDVYAKICLTSDPENTVSTKIINGGGRNPIFDENLKLNVRKLDCSLKCEIWMLSRVQNYMQDQLLGFALVPMSDILVNDGKLEKEFSLSSTDLFHSPAGFVELALSFDGEPPEVIAIPAIHASNDVAVVNAISPESTPSDFDKIEFPDPTLVNENDQMVSEYIGINCNGADSKNSVSYDPENPAGSEIGVQVVESSPNGTISSKALAKHDSPQSRVSTNGTAPASLPLTSQSSERPGGSKSPSEEYVSPPKDVQQEKSTSAVEVQANASGSPSSNAAVKPLVSVSIEPEPKVVQQDIVDMYMKSMQQFTESLAKMKLPMDFESGQTSSGNSSSDQKSPAAKTPGSRVFYGSRAFF